MTRHTRYNPPAESIDTRQLDDSRDGMFAVRLPISSTATARDGEAFSRDRLRAFQQQIRERTVPVFIDHGQSDIGVGEDPARYSALGKIGRVADPDLEQRDDVTDLVAELRVADPDVLASEAGDVGDVEPALRWLRQQAELGLLATSVGWSEDDLRDTPGDAELLEVSVVGIPSDPQAQQSADAPAAVRSAAEDLPSPDEADRPTVTSDAAAGKDWGFRALAGREPEAARSDVEKVREALATLGEAPRLVPHSRVQQAAPGVQVVRETEPTHEAAEAYQHLRELLEADAGDETVSDRLARLRGDDPYRSASEERAELVEAVQTIERDRRRQVHHRHRLDDSADTPYLDALKDVMEAVGMTARSWWLREDRLGRRGRGDVTVREWEVADE
jgi:hypothetical protein